MIRSRKLLIAALSISVTAAGVQSGQAGLNGHGMTKNWCREQVINKGITDTAKFKIEMKKCLDDPTTYK